MTRWANDDEARELLAKRPHGISGSEYEAGLLKAARDVFPGVHRLRCVVGMGPDGERGYAWVVVDTEDRRGHCVGGHAGVGVETDAVAAGRLVSMAREAAEHLAQIVLVPRRATVGRLDA